MARGKKDPETGLTGKETVFCEQVAYNPEMTASDAYRAAYSCGRMKSETVNRNAHALANNSKIKAMVAKLREERNERVKIDADWVLRRLGDIDEMDVADILDNVGNILPITKWPKVWRTTISGFDLQELMSGDTESMIRKIKWPDKVKNIEMIGKHVDVAAFKEIKELTGKNGGAVQIDARTIAAELDPVEASRLYREFVTQNA